MLVAAIAAFAALIPATANADIASTAATTYGTTVPGGHGDYEIRLGFDFPGEYTTEDVKDWIIDSPAGLVGNPNAVPYDDRCSATEFLGASNVLAPAACPASSIVGYADVNYNLDSTPATIAATKHGIIYMLQNATASTSEVPVTLGTSFAATTVTDPTCAALGQASPCTVYPRTKSDIQPVTSGVDGDFRLRTVPQANVSTSPAGVHISQITQHIYGYPNNDTANPPYLTMPTNCGPWNSYVYGKAVVATPSANSDPKFSGSNEFVKSAADAVTPDCSTLPNFPASASITLSTLTRGSNPQVDVSVNGIGTMGDDYPKTVVTTLPASITTDVQGIANPCEIADADASTCPATSKVGTASASTPMLTAPLTGDVYMVRGEGGKAVPDLRVYFNNPPNPIRSFQMKGTTKFVGASSNQIETTFDNSPQNPISSFKMSLVGGTTDKPDSMLTISACPDGTDSPPDGPITFAMTGFSGQAATSSSTPALADCFGIAKLKKIRKCVRYNLKVSPSYSSRSGLMKSELWAKAKVGKNKGKYIRIKTVRRGSFRLNVKLRSSRWNSGTYRYKIRAVYNPTAANPTPKVYQRYQKFSKC